MGKIIAYKPVIKFPNGAMVEVTLDDWYEDDDVIKEIKKVTGCSVMNDILNVIKSGKAVNMRLVDGRSANITLLNV